MKRAILLLAIPMVIEMFMESLFAVVDVFFVAKLGREAVATVGLTESVLTVVYSLGFGVSMAATALVARRIGEKNPNAASRVAGQALVFGLLLSLPISLTGIFFGDRILTLMGASTEIVRHGTNFTRWMIGGNFVILLLFLLNGVFRGAGNASIAMRALWISNGLNIVLDPVLIMGWGPIPAYGLDGAAYATNIGRGMGVAYQLYCLFNGTGIIRLHLSDFRPRTALLGKILNISSGGAGQFIISSASWIFLMRIVARFGDAAIAGYTIGIRVLIFTILPAWGMANAASTLVGQNLGAGKPERAQHAVLLTALYNVLFLGVVSVLYFFLTPNIIGIFTDEPAILEHGVECLRFLSLGYVFFAFGMVVMQAFNGAGDTRTPTILNLIAFWMLQIPLAYLFSIQLQAGPKGVYIAVLISEGLLALAAVAVFRRGRWKLKQV
ncbi:MAG: MATE family efflux transporter [Flavobacteriales bacterium]|nr:MATE family efflux transporter [Flavobacteriales bacterium]